MAGSLFASSADGRSLSAASQWVVELVSGQLVTTIAVIAVAFLGYEMLSGQISFRSALRVVLGCFILLSSAVIAGGFMVASRGTLGGAVEAASYVSAPAAAPAYLPPSAPTRTTGNPFDPYANRPPPN